MSAFRVLPLVIGIDDDGTPSIRALCGAEAGQVSRSVTTTRRMRATASLTRIAPDASDLGVLRMILHARNCRRCKELMAALRHPLTPAAVAAPLAAAGANPPPAGRPWEEGPAGGAPTTNHEAGRPR